MTNAETLIRELRDAPAAGSRVAILKQLGKYSSEEVVAALALELENILTRRGAVEALGRCSNSRAVVVLRKQLELAGPTMQAEIITALGKRLGKDFARELVERPIGPKEYEIREAATEVLANNLDVEGAGRKISEILIENGSLDTRKAAFKALGKCDDGVTRDKLVENLTGQGKILNSRYAGEALGMRAARGDEKAFQELVGAIESGDGDSVRGAVAGLKAYGKADALEPLGRALEKARMEHVKSEIMDAIKACGGNPENLCPQTNSKEGIEHVIPNSDGTGTSPGRESPIKPSTPEGTIPDAPAAALEAAKRAAEWVSRTCSAAQPMRVAAKGGSIVIEVFDREAPIPHARKAPIEQPKAPKAAEKPMEGDYDTLATNLYDGDSAVRMKAAEGLGNGQRDDDASILLSGILYDDSADVKATVVNSLGNVGTKEAIAPLMQVLSDDSVDAKIVETAIRRIIGDSDSESVGKALMQGAEELRRGGVKLGKEAGNILDKLMAGIKSEQEIPKTTKVDANKLAMEVEHVAKINGRGGKRRKR